MFVNPDLCLNSFKDVNVPKGRDYVQRYGLAGVPANSYTGDDVAPIGQSKLDSIKEAHALYADQLSDPNEE